MKFRLLLALLAAVACLAPRLAAQADDDEDNYIDLGFYADAKSNVRVGFRMLEGAQVKFRNLGNVSLAPVAPLAEGAANRVYTDGYVAKDAERTSSNSSLPAEVDADGNQLGDRTTPGRYIITQAKVDSNGNPVVDDNGNPRTAPIFNGIAYKSGQSRSWNIQHADQVSADGNSVTLNQYTAISEGAALNGRNRTVPGVEVQLARDLRKFGPFTLSLVGGISLNTIRAERKATISATLHTVADTYRLTSTLTDPASSVPYTGPTTGTLTDPDDGSIISLGGYETTIPIADTPVTRTVTDTAGGAEIDGVWKVKGAYYSMRVGSEIRTNLFKGLSLSAGAGLTGTYAGTTFTSIQRLKIESTGDEYTLSEVSVTDKYLGGYYANFDAAWAVNERSGFFAGLTYESLGSYKQTISGQVAKVDLNSLAGLRGGISVKF